MYSYKLDLKIDKIPININIVKSPLNTKGFAEILSINLEYTNKLNRVKNRINDINSIHWEESKKLSNPYEFIYAFNSKSKFNDYRSVSLIKPLSRSFFKMIEIIYEFCPNILNIDNCNIIDSVDTEISNTEISNTEISNTEISNTELETNDIPIILKRLISVHIAEGPGGFIEAVRYLRNINNYRCDLAFGMTLIKYERNDIHKHAHVPGWKQSQFFLENNPEVHIVTGADGSGDIYKQINIDSLNNTMRSLGKQSNDSVYGGADLVTADGGFDYSIEYNYQEQASCKLIFSQILGALKCQKQRGLFICKFFDMNSYFTVEMLYLLYTTYKTITIYKPLTSRIANSEKYIICSNFQGINPNLLNTLFDILCKWNLDKENTINHMFETIPIEFIEKIKLINKNIIDLQIKSINNIIDNIKNNKITLDKAWCDSKIEMQIQKAKEWCKKYNIPYKL